jgi:hypothetical protein
MTSRSIAGTAAASALCLAVTQSTSGQTAAPAHPRVAVVVDGRGRLESDVRSTREDGTPRDDRHRGRMRARVEVRGSVGRSWLVIGRVRTGSPLSEQSPHVTLFDLSGGRRDALRAVADKYVVHYTANRIDIWGGRNEFPFWTQNEMFWDRDVTLAGGAVAYRAPLRRPALRLTAGYFGLPDGAVELRGRMAAGQIVAAVPVSDALSFQAAAGLFDMHGASTNKYLLASGARDYRIAVGSLQATRTLRHKWLGALRVGADVLRNLQAYAADPDPGVVALRHATTGIVLTSALSGRKQAGQRHAWEVGHTYARIEKLAVHASYAQDDWVRWGSATQTDASDLRGSEANGRYWISRDVDVHARAFFVRSLSRPQHGSRVRVDLNWRLAFQR